MTQELRRNAELLISTAEMKLTNHSGRATLWGLLSPDLRKSKEILQRAKRSYDAGEYVQAIKTIKIDFELAILEAQSELEERVQQAEIGIAVIVLIISFVIWCRRRQRF